jgi:hypothetical protein
MAESVRSVEKKIQRPRLGWLCALPHIKSY